MDGSPTIIIHQCPPKFYLYAKPPLCSLLPALISSLHLLASCLRAFVLSAVGHPSNMKNKVNEILRKCKSLSSKLGRSSSYSSIRSKSERLEEDFYRDVKEEDLVEKEIIYVGMGSLRRRYLIKARLLDHPLVSALINRSKESIQTGHAGGDGPDSICVKCEIVIFDHLLWMLENDDLDITTDSLEELAELYAY